MHKFDNDLESTLQRYLKQQLSEEQAVAFEDYFVDKPELIEKVESARAMMHGLETLSPQISDFVPEAEANQAALITRLLAWLSGPVPAYGVAACAVLMLGATWWLPPQSVVPPLNQTFADVELLNFNSGVKRNNSLGIVVELSESERVRNVAFIKLPIVNYRQYELSALDPQSKAELWRSKPFIFSALNDKMISLPNTLNGSSALLQLFGIEQSGKKVSVEFCHYSEACQPKG